MTLLDWLLVVGINLGIVAYGLAAYRGVERSFDWFLAAKSLPWWAVGLSAFATAVDSGDYVAIVGGSYRFGLSQLSQWWLGLPIGWFVLSFFVLIPLYRSGVYTNSEWLEFRFGPLVRVLAVFINVQSRTNVIGNILFSLYLVLQVVAGLEPSWSWAVVVLVAATAVAHVISGGLQSSVITNVLQGAAMFTASLVLWGVVWTTVGGWSGLEQRLGELDPGLADTLLHVGGYHPPGVPVYLVIFGFVIVLTAYAVINQYEAIRFLGARSEWDFKMAAVLASIATALTLWFNVSLGPMARADFPALEIVDQAYPLMVKKYLPPGLIGLVVAGLLAAAYSTFSSIGMGISSLVVRDLYARFLVRNASDEHYTRIGKLSVPVVVALGFLYLPFLQSGMLAFYLRLAGAISVPLMTVILMGVFTRARRESGAPGLLAGLLYGVSAILAETFEWPLPSWYTNLWWAYLWNILLPVTVMLITSRILDLWRGPAAAEGLEGLIYSRTAPARPARPLSERLGILEGTWLQRTLQEAPAKPAHPWEPEPLGWRRRPALYVALYLLAAALLLFVLLW